jgi:hypothetical protein
LRKSINVTEFPGPQFPPMRNQHQSPRSDIEIAQQARMWPIAKVAHQKLGVNLKHLMLYGHYKAKLSLDYIRTLEGRPNGKLILVTAMTPTPAGEGKTTTTVGLGDALNHLGERAIICLREPSLGPCSSMPLVLRITCWPLLSTITCTGAILWGWMPGGLPGGAPSI